MALTRDLCHLVNKNLNKQKVIAACKDFQASFEREKKDAEVQYKNQIANIDARLNRLLDMRENGEVTSEEYRERKNTLLDMREKMSIESSEEENLKMSVFFDISGQLFEALEMASESYLQGNDEKRAIFLKLMVRNMEWDGDYLSITLSGEASTITNFDKFDTWCTLLDEVRNTITLEELLSWKVLTPSLLGV